MSFWGVLIKSGSPYTLRHDPGGGEAAAVPPRRRRLRISQATLEAPGLLMNTRSVVSCSVGAKPPILICALTPRESTSCPLDLEFDESEDVVFSSTGPRGVYLAGYYLPSHPHPHPTTNHEEDAHNYIGGSLIAEDANTNVLPSHDLEVNQWKDGLSSTPTLQEPLTTRGTAEKVSDNRVVSGDLNIRMSSCNEVTVNDPVINHEQGLSNDEMIVPETDESAQGENQICISAHGICAADGKSTNGGCNLNNCQDMDGVSRDQEGYVRDSWTSDECPRLSNKLASSLQVGNRDQKSKENSDSLNEQDEVGNALTDQELTKCNLNDALKDKNPRSKKTEMQKEKKKRKKKKLERGEVKEKEHRDTYPSNGKGDSEYHRPCFTDQSAKEDSLPVFGQKHGEGLEKIGLQCTGTKTAEITLYNSKDKGPGGVDGRQSDILGGSGYERSVCNIAGKDKVDENLPEINRLGNSEKPIKEKKRKRKVERVPDKEKECQEISHNTLKTKDNSENLSHQPVRDESVPSTSFGKGHVKDIYEKNKVLQHCGNETSKVNVENAAKDNSVGRQDVTQTVMNLKKERERSVNSDACLEKSIKNCPDESLEIANMPKDIAEKTRETKKRKKKKVANAEDKEGEHQAVSDSNCATNDGSEYKRPGLTRQHLGETPVPCEASDIVHQKEALKEKGNEKDYREKKKGSKSSGIETSKTRERNHKDNGVQNEDVAKSGHGRSIFSDQLLQNASVPSFEGGCMKARKEKGKSAKSSRIKTSKILEHNYEDNGAQNKDVAKGDNIIKSGHDRSCKELQKKKKRRKIKEESKSQILNDVSPEDVRVKHGELEDDSIQDEDSSIRQGKKKLKSEKTEEIIEKGRISKDGCCGDLYNASGRIHDQIDDDTNDPLVEQSAYVSKKRKTKVEVKVKLVSHATTEKCKSVRGVTGQ